MAVSVKSRIFIGFGIIVTILGAVVVASALMVREYRDAVAAMEEDSVTASLIQDTRSDAGNAALLLQRYVITGDETLVPEIRDSTAAAVAAISEAARSEMEADPDTALALAQIAASAQPLADDVDAVIAQRQSGDIAGAAAALDEIAPRFRAFRIILGEEADAELQDLAYRSAEADRAGDITFVFLIAAGLGGAVAAAAASLLIARSILKPLALLDATARLIGDGDLDARTNASGPRELANLGSTLNDMADRLQQRERDLILANAELRERNRQLMEARVQAATDGLTNLPNHRTFHETLRRLVPNESGSPVSLIMMDIDGFKDVNDDLGHPVGDQILCVAAAAFTRVISGNGVYRYGGDEFAVLLPGTSIDEAEAIAESLRSAMDEASSSAERHITISLGIASYPETADSPEQLIYQADAAMYAAKMAGKNRACRWDRMPTAGAGMPYSAPVR